MCRLALGGLGELLPALGFHRNEGVVFQKSGSGSAFVPGAARAGQPNIAGDARQLQPQIEVRLLTVKALQARD